MTGQDDLDRLFEVMADPYRRGFVERLCKGPATVTELAAPAAVQLPAVLKHLKVLEDGGIVVSEKTGRTRTFQMRKDAFVTLAAWVDHRQREMNAAFDRLADLMAEIPEKKDH
ncbi:ArsR/SmtB family transcription factor [Pelagibacterium halotolerans]|uniref:Transcriptional regulator, ArsR family n=1 Tax=Pelagibacterium halotolerans (strain DSM 22347 / JCM 15775 / CGMCC 1.7692 / B2) TaxID=1082931 RepID=G4RCN2_PELHB|nr:metalloregulator ArsR/SmtB family transcription factor [Pelagibacterium halotolerans]AEQ50704.1 transcriptional regulator, ArsR family [Pelagibacterium halotolerans B2]QJR19368.1 winged helix-turn-helix transcriptional regulator [Pelagibacterium halotolerans]SDZ93528.1 transcriptional regulator, ArsR family [Pelagibacterium halotolerans]